MNETFVQANDLTAAKGKFIFDMLVEIADDPQEASSIIMSLMINLWLIGSADDGNLDRMLRSFTLGVRTNIDMARTNDRRTAN